MPTGFTAIDAVLLTLQAVLPTRTRPAKQRLYLPKRQVSKCVLASDTRAVLTPDAIARAGGRGGRNCLSGKAARGRWRAAAGQSVCC